MTEAGLLPALGISSLTQKRSERQFYRRPGKVRRTWTAQGQEGDTKMRGGKDTIGALDQKNVARAHHPGSDVSKLSESHWCPRSPLIQAPLHCTERGLQTCAGRFPEDAQEKQCFPESLINTLICRGVGRDSQVLNPEESQVSWVSWPPCLDVASICDLRFHCGLSWELIRERSGSQASSEHDLRNGCA